MHECIRYEGTQRRPTSQTANLPNRGLEVLHALVQLSHPNTLPSIDAQSPCLQGQRRQSPASGSEDERLRTQMRSCPVHCRSSTPVARRDILGFRGREVRDRIVELQTQRLATTRPIAPPRIRPAAQSLCLARNRPPFNRKCRHSARHMMFSRCHLAESARCIESRERRIEVRVRCLVQNPPRAAPDLKSRNRIVDRGVAFGRQSADALPAPDRDCCQTRSLFPREMGRRPVGSPMII